MICKVCKIKMDKVGNDMFVCPSCGKKYKFLPKPKTEEEKKEVTKPVTKNAGLAKPETKPMPKAPVKQGVNATQETTKKEQNVASEKRVMGMPQRRSVNGMPVPNSPQRRPQNINQSQKHVAQRQQPINQKEDVEEDVNGLILQQNIPYEDQHLSQKLLNERLIQEKLLKEQLKNQKLMQYAKKAPFSAGRVISFIFFILFYAGIAASLYFFDFLNFKSVSESIIVSIQNIFDILLEKTTLHQAFGLIGGQVFAEYEILFKVLAVLLIIIAALLVLSFLVTFFKFFGRKYSGKFDISMYVLAFVTSILATAIQIILYILLSNQSNTTVINISFVYIIVAITFLLAIITKILSIRKLPKNMDIN